MSHHTGTAHSCIIICHVSFSLHNFFCMFRYEELNVKCLETVRGYHKDVPVFPLNRPPFFLDHCLKRLQQTSGRGTDDIRAVTSGMYSV